MWHTGIVCNYAVSLQTAIANQANHCIPSWSWGACRQLHRCPCPSPQWICWLRCGGSSAPCQAGQISHQRKFSCSCWQRPSKERAEGLRWESCYSRPQKCSVGLYGPCAHYCSFLAGIKVAHVVQVTCMQQQQQQRQQYQQQAETSNVAAITKWLNHRGCVGNCKAYTCLNTVGTWHLKATGRVKLHLDLAGSPRAAVCNSLRTTQFQSWVSSLDAGRLPACTVCRSACSEQVSASFQRHMVLPHSSAAGQK